MRRLVRCLVALSALAVPQLATAQLLCPGGSAPAVNVALTMGVLPEDDPVAPWVPDPKNGQATIVPDASRLEIQKGVASWSRSEPGLDGAPAALAHARVTLVGTQFAGSSSVSVEVTTLATEDRVFTVRASQTNFTTGTLELVLASGSLQTPMSWAVAHDVTLSVDRVNGAQVFVDSSPAPMLSAAYTDGAAPGTGTPPATVAFGGSVAVKGNAPGAADVEALDYHVCASLSPPLIVSPQDGEFFFMPSLPVQGTAAALAQVSVAADGSAVGQAVADSAGNWTLTTSPLADGPHALTAVASVGGVSSAPSPAVGVTVDTVAPDPPLIVYPGAGAAVAAASFPVMGFAEPLSRVTVSEAGAALGAADADGSGFFAAQVNLAAGGHTITAVAEDRATNVSLPSAPVTFTVAGSIDGGAGHLHITSVGDQPNPFSSPASTTLTVCGTVDRVQGLGGNGKVDFSACLGWTIDGATGLVHEDTTCSPIGKSAGTSFCLALGWDGNDPAGNPVPAGAYTYGFEVGIARTPPGGSVTNLKAPDCTRVSAGYNGPCLVDSGGGGGGIGWVPPLPECNVGETQDCDGFPCPGVQRCTSTRRWGACVAPHPITCGVGACQSRATCADPTVCTPLPPSPEICPDGKDNDCNGVVDDCCNATSFTPVPWELSSRGEYPHDPADPLNENYTNNIRPASRGLLFSPRVTTYEVGFSDFRTAGGDIVDLGSSRLGEQALSGVHPRATGPCDLVSPLPPVIPPDYAYLSNALAVPTASSFSNFGFSSDGSTTDAGWKTAYMFARCGAATANVPIVSPGTLQYGTLIQPGDQVLVTVPALAGYHMRIHLAYPPVVSATEVDGPTPCATHNFPFRAAVTTAQPGGGIGLAAGVRVFDMASCYAAYAPFSGPRDECESAGFPSTSEWIGEVVDLPVFQEDATWRLAITSLEGEGPFTLFASIELAHHGDPIDFAMEAPSSSGTARLAYAETAALTQAMMQVSEGEYSISDEYTFSDDVYCFSCHDIVFGDTDKIPSGACTSGFAETEFAGTFLSYIYLPKDYWQRSGKYNCGQDTLERVGQVLAHEWGHYEFLLPDESGPDFLHGGSFLSDCPSSSSGDCCGHTLMGTADALFKQNKVQWCTDFNHGKDADPGMPGATGPSNWSLVRAVYPAMAPFDGDPGAPRFGPFGAAMRSGWLRLAP